MKMRSSWPAVASTIRSIRGKEKLSFGQARLTSVKSMQSRHFPFSIFLFDEDHISQPVRVFYFSDSFGLEEFVNFFIDRLLSFWGESPSFCLTGLKVGLMFSLCVITEGLIPPISSCFQANTSIFYFKKWIRRSLTSLANLDPM